MRKLIIITVTVLVMTAVLAHADGWDTNTKFTNMGGMQNTRHNLSLSTITLSPAGWDGGMLNSQYLNFYGEVCVYCHTPHGANSTIDAPLWNRTNLGNSYTLYNIPLQSGQTPTQPGVNSLTCLSCHDGTLAIDSIINMPGSGKYLASQETSKSSAFLDSWPGPGGGGHLALPTCASSCHNGSNYDGFDYPDFRAFVIGTDLTDDHPVGVQLPDTGVYDFNAPTATTASMKIYDTNGNSRADSNEVRFYNTGEGYEVECASCHDPHGVESAGPGSMFIPSFLRVNNNNASSLCLTCHVK